MLTVFTVTIQETTFALEKIVEFNLCGYIMTQTKYPKLFILEILRGRTFKTRSKNLRQQSRYICIYQFKVYVYREAYQNPS